MSNRLAYLNESRKHECLGWRNDFTGQPCYPFRMAAPRNDWYLKEWLKALNKRQADIARDLDMNKAKVSLTAAGKQPYDRDAVNAIADYLNIRPYELLMHPDDAMTLRKLRADVLKLASTSTALESAEAERPLKKVSLN